MNDLRRELAPLGRPAWRAIEDEAARVLKQHLAARQLIDFRGPLGWQASAVNLGRVTRIDEPLEEQVEARLRWVQPLVELRSRFALARDDLDDASRGAEDLDLQPLVDAARRLARAEDRLVFSGFQPAQVRGLVPTARHRPLPIPTDLAKLPQCVSEALQLLRTAGVGGPYALALSLSLYQQVQGTSLLGGNLLLPRLEKLVGGAVVWSAALEGGLVMSQRGGDFELVVGRDISLGYQNHDLTSVQLYLVESVTFRIRASEAVVPLQTA